MKNQENKIAKHASATGEKLGRPVNENSARQIRLKEIQAKREAGLIKRGRPSVPGSMNALKKELQLAKKLSGVEIKRGRPVNPESARAKRIADLEARRANGTLKLGRPKMVVIEVPVKAKAKTKSKVVAK
jgi:hypothetical protein